LCDKL